MKRLKAILLTLIPCINLYGQINISDSTVQVSGFWSKGDKKTYSITQKKINIKGADTLSNEQTKFYVDIIIIDSASESTGEEAPNREEFKNFSNTTRVISWIHETGWLLYSIEKKVVKTADRTTIEERRIEIEQQ